MKRIFWKVFICSLHFQWRLKFLEKVLILLKKGISTKKLPIRKVESFSKSNFDLKQICKTVFFYQKNYQFLEWRLDTGLCISPPKCEIFLLFPMSYIRSVSCEASGITRLWCYNKFVILDINVRFNCGESVFF